MSPLRVRQVPASEREHVLMNSQARILVGELIEPGRVARQFRGESGSIP